MLEKQVDNLKKAVYRLQLERDVLEKAAEVLKKDKGINLNTLRNSEKAEIIGALKKISAERTPLCSTYVQKQLLLPGKSSPRPG